ncbi:MAG: AAA family ATPase [Deltaproteobacteria bacterium]|nr:AAA family ATPase [Deltaproteobacteria bacterium]
MRLEKLKLHNFRGFENFELDFHPEVTVLVGINGSGKTSILDAVADVFKPIFGSGFDGGFIGPTDCRQGKNTAGIQVAGFYGDPKQPVEAAHLFDNGRWVSGTVDSIAFTQEQKENGPLPVLCYYPVNRHAIDSTPGSTNPRVWTPEHALVRALGQSTVNYNDFFHWFRELEDLENEDRNHSPDYVNPQLQTVRQALKYLLPGYSSPRVRRPRFGPEKKELATTKPVLVIKKDGQELPFDQLSEGERTMAALVCDIARRLAIANPGSTEPLKGDGIVMIDEIDLHLHPQWQEKVIPTLRSTFPNIQFIVTTHSPIVLGYVPKECVRLLHDFELVESPPTEGRDPNSIYIDVFGQKLRKPEFDTKINKIALLIDEEKLEEADEKLDLLAEKFGTDDGEVVRLRTLIAMLRED